MPISVALSPSSAGENSHFIRQNTHSHTTVPITLKLRCTRAARLAFLLAPMLDRIAVMQVPMFWPMMMGTAAP